MPGRERQIKKKWSISGSFGGIENKRGLVKCNHPRSITMDNLGGIDLNTFAANIPHYSLFNWARLNFLFGNYLNMHDWCLSRPEIHPNEVVCVTSCGFLTCLGNHVGHWYSMIFSSVFPVDPATSELYHLQGANTKLLPLEKCWMVVQNSRFDRVWPSGLHN